VTLRHSLVLAAVLLPTTVTAQSTGGIVGHVRDASTSRALSGVEVRIDGGRFRATTDTAGSFRFRGIPSGSHLIEVSWPGYRPARRDDVVVPAGEIVSIAILLAPTAVELEELIAYGILDPVLDPLATQTVQRITAVDLRRLPVSSLEDAIALQAGVVGESFRGGRAGQQSFLLDGFGVKNALDAASSEGSGLRIPPDLIAEAQLVTNGFSARFGQAVSGLVSVTTRDGGDSWRGRIAYETDRPMAGVADLGLDRFVFQADGPLGRGITAVGIVDLSARIDFDPVNAPKPEDPRDPRATTSRPLPHNSGETWTAGGKLTIPLSQRLTGRLFGLATTEQRYLYDQRYKYEPEFAPGRRTDALLLTSHLQLLPAPTSRRPIIGDLRFGYFEREFVRGDVEAPDFTFGAFTGRPLDIRGQELARSQDTVAAREAQPGFNTPTFSDRTPWGVPGFFLGGASQGEISWNRFRELRTQLDMSVVLGQYADLHFGGMLASQDINTFQRVLAFQAVGGTVPGATASAFSPVTTGAYVEAQARAADLGFTAGLRYDTFDPGGELSNATVQRRTTVNPRVAVSTVLEGATVVASLGKFSQPPDMQFLVDAAFDDTVRTGRFRQGNPNLGFEQATQFELSARILLRELTTLKINIFTKNLTGLVSSTPLGVNPDSSIFLNADRGNVIGAEVIFELERTRGWGARIAGSLQRAEGTVSDAFRLQRLIRIDPNTGDTLPPPARSEFPLDFDRRASLIATVDHVTRPDAGPRFLGGHIFGGVGVAGVFRFASGLPFSRVDSTGVNLLFEPNGSRLPSQWTLDGLLRKEVRFGKMAGGVYLDVRNVTDRRNQVATRRDTGNPRASLTTIEKMAQDAFQANPGAIPFESPRYRPEADLNRDGIIAGSEELLPLFRAAAADFTQPLFVFGPPRLIRFGMEILF
jgi:hypothetical protein